MRLLRKFADGDYVHSWSAAEEKLIRQLVNMGLIEFAGQVNLGLITCAKHRLTPMGRDLLEDLNFGRKEV